MKTKNKFFSLVIVMLLAGCVSMGRKIDQEAVDQIKVGKTTKSEVIRKLGSPDQITRSGSGDTTFMYMFSRVESKAENFIPYVNMFAGGMKMQNQNTLIIFDSDGIVKDYTTSQGANETGYNLGAGSKAKIDDVEKNKRPR